MSAEDILHGWTVDDVEEEEVGQALQVVEEDQEPGQQGCIKSLLSCIQKCKVKLSYGARKLNISKYVKSKYISCVLCITKNMML